MIQYANQTQPIVSALLRIMEGNMEVKKIIQKIMREKYAKRNRCKNLIVEMNKETYCFLEKENAILKWKENFPCALCLHEDICGLPIRIADIEEVRVVECIMG